MRKIRILHITQSNGGVEEYLKMFFKYRDREKFSVELICPKYPSMIKEIEDMDVKVHVVDMKREISPFHDIKAFIEVDNYIKNINPDIIHIHSSKAGVIGRFAAYKNKVLCIYNSHGWAFSMGDNEKKKKVYAFIERICAKITNKIVNISDNERKLALKYKVASADKMITICNGIDLEIYNTSYNKYEILNSLNIPENAFIIGMVGRITAQKSPETFLNIAEKLSEYIENVYFILVGDGESRIHIEQLILEKGLKDKVKITGWTDEVVKYISVFDIGVLTSKWEGFGLVLAEYMACGKPIVASNVGGIPDVVHNNRNGILVDSSDINGFVESILKIKEDECIRKSFVQNSIKDVREKFNINRVVKEHEELYMDLLENK